MAKKDHGNFILINYSAHINNSPSQSSIRGSCFKSDERLVFPEFLHGSSSLGLKKNKKYVRKKAYTLKSSKDVSNAPKWYVAKLEQAICKYICALTQQCYGQ